MRVVFMGTPDIAETCLKKITERGFDVVGVYTKPDTPKNRGMKLTQSPVKEYALSRGIPVYQPLTFKDDEVVEELRALGLAAPDTVELLYELRSRGIDIPLDAMTVEECADAICHAFSGEK